ncbi:MAG TPA: MFS transporter [Casimicrobiaceae bacterium]|nr:MFS transporter [Casimicrobiaceae bacterium]
MRDTTTPLAIATDSPRLSRGLMALLAITVFTTASAMHFQTPMLERIRDEFGATPAAVGWIPTLSFAGFLAGTVFLIPLGDRYDKRTLILGKLAVLLVAVLTMALAPSLPVLWAASFVIGVSTSLSQHVVPLVAELAEPKQRGGAVGTVLSGLFLGILFARVIGGVVAATLGWRWMYVISLAMLLTLAAALIVRLPSAPARTAHGYGELMRSLVHLLIHNVALRRASITQFLLGIGYGGFWATIAPMMHALHGLGPTATGLIGIPGASGIVIARSAGRWMDRRGAGPVVALGIALVIAAFVVFGFGALWVAALVVGAMLLDCGLRAAMVANQTLVTSVDPSARSRLSTVFAAHIWGGNAVGAFLASTAFTHFGWWAVCAISFAAAALAMVLHRRAR